LCNTQKLFVVAVNLLSKAAKLEARKGYSALHKGDFTAISASFH